MNINPNSWFSKWFAVYAPGEKCPDIIWDEKFKELNLTEEIKMPAAEKDNHIIQASKMGLFFYGPNGEMWPCGLDTTSKFFYPTYKSILEKIQPENMVWASATIIDVRASMVKAGIITEEPSRSPIAENKDE